MESPRIVKDDVNIKMASRLKKGDTIIIDVESLSHVPISKKDVCF